MILVFFVIILIILAIFFLFKKCKKNYPYNHKEDYIYKFRNADKLETTIKDNLIKLESDLSNKTVFLEIDYKSTLLGYFFNPKIIFNNKNEKSVLYLEKGGKGKRYLNISHLNFKNELQIKTIFCNLNNNVKLYVYNNKIDFKKDKVLILSPHPDDAEICCYGLYKQFKNVYIINISIGEGSYNNFYPYVKKIKKARLIKGNIRFWESINIPQLGNVNSNNCINLSYYGGLKNIFKTKKSLNDEDFLVFRKKNICPFVKLLNDELNWDNLIEDLSILIKKINPDIIITPFPILDSDSDHKLTTYALIESIQNINNLDSKIFLYTNHLTNYELYPIGPMYSPISLPPIFHELYFDSIFSCNLSIDQQLNKLFVLDSMIDIRHSIEKTTLKGALKNLVHIINKRFFCGDDYSYFRRSVRRNEVFFIIDSKNILNKKIRENIMGKL